MVLSEQDEGKLQKLCESEGYEGVDALLSAFALDGIVPGICVSPGCDYITDSIEPDQTQGYCDAAAGRRSSPASSSQG